MKALLYARFSPRPKGDECESADKQLERLRARAQADALPVRGEYADRDTSGGGKGTELDPADELATRFALWRLLDDMQPGDTILVTEPSRLGRSPFAMEFLRRLIRKKGGKLLYLEGFNGESPEQILLATILDGFHAFQRSIIRLRTSVAMRKYMRQGRQMGGKAPYGWTHRNGRLVEVLDEQAVLNDIKSMRTEGMRPYWIVKQLNESGSRTRCGAPWTICNLQRVIKRQIRMELEVFSGDSSVAPESLSSPGIRTTRL